MKVQIILISHADSKKIIALLKSKAISQTKISNYTGISQHKILRLRNGDISVNNLTLEVA